MDLSIIIVSWNAQKFLMECLDSFSRKKNRYDMEIIVVDNASSDGSPEAVHNEFPQVKLLRNKTNFGFAKANNLGVKQSTGDYIIFANSDIKVLDGCVDRMYDYMKKNPSIGMLGPKILNLDLSLQPSCRKFPSLWNMLCRALGLDNIFPQIRYYRQDSVCDVEVLSGCFWMVRREALNQVGLLDENFFMYAEDLDWCKRFWNAAWKVVYFPYASVVHYGGGSSSNAPIKFYIELLRANLQYWKKHHSRLAQIGFLFISLLYHAMRICGSIILYPLRSTKKQEVKLKIKRSIACLSWLFQIPGESTKGEKCTQ